MISDCTYLHAFTQPHMFACCSAYSYTFAHVYKRGPLYRNKAGGNRRSLLFLSYVTFGGCWWLGGSQGLRHDPSICCGSPLRCWPMAGSWAFQGRVRLVFGGVLDHQKCYTHRVFCTGSVAECVRMYETAKNSSCRDKNREECIKLC